MSVCLILSVLAVDPPPIAFRDVAAESGVVFRFHTGSRGKHDMIEVMGGGVAMIDSDSDGHLDLYFPNGGPIEGDGPDPPGTLFRNKGDGTFTPLPDPPPGPPYAMGCAVGDYDGDGREDLFVSGWRGQRLYQNLGGGKFADVTEHAGLACDLWTTAAAFADLDDDGDLDLFVVAYLDVDPATAPFIAAPDGQRDFGAPDDFPSQLNRLYCNNGDGTFTDVAKSAGVARPEGRGLGVVVADLVGDPKLDVFVANDDKPCFLFENRGGLRFDEVGVAAGVALDGRGKPLAGMGVALGEVGSRETLLVGNFIDRTTIAFAALDRGVFEDATARLGLDVLTRRVTGFGLALADFDGDGLLDFLQTNGHVLDRERLGDPFAMRMTLLRNAGNRFIDAAPTAGPAFARPILGRGLAIGDLDNDGRPDAVVGVLDGPALVLRNVTPSPPGLMVELVGKPPANREAIGAIVKARVGDRTLVRRVIGGGSYLSASDRRVHIGLEGAAKADRLEVAWPSGRKEVWTHVEGGRKLRLVEGTGIPP